MSAPLSSSSALDRVFFALSDATRRAILARLAKGDAAVNDLVALFDMSQPAISKHLKVLEEAGLISRTKTGQFRPCHLEPAPLQAAHTWLGNYRGFFEATLDNLAAYLDELKAAEDAAAEDAAAEDAAAEDAPAPAPTPAPEGEQA